MAFFKSLLFEDYCHYCGLVDNIICFECINQKINNYKIRYIRGKKVIYFFENDPKIIELIVSYKDKKIKSLGPILSFITFIGLELLAKNQIHTVVNIPTSWVNIKKRDGDPIAKMVENACLLNKSNFKYQKNLIQNRQSRIDQVGLNFRERKLNLENSFKAGSSKRWPILLVDDLVTTGTSLSEAIRVLESKGNFITGCVVIASK